MIGLFVALILVGLLLNRGYIMAHLTSEFRFEKYKTAKAAESALLELHPLESSVDELVNTLKKAGSKCGPEKYPPHKEKYKKTVVCGYIIPGILFYHNEWVVYIDKNQQETIGSINIYKKFNAL